ncbi:hypothetical protein Q9L42_010125 [Methylomarinum sp. Ch1-1]|uniref:Uncharacterized protein n=1 Tax=Methylomarinum roseum TaxID=3067653 RepID=A0AAU7NZT0_9GAMM|nr:hypothetical protein [Methylomarinum sp. Ch1-1]MDP4521396.1 hypothetical protein [Methylomarinum sp. Ch1-1]
MEIFDSINLFLLNHPVMLGQLELMFRIKFWLLLGLAIFFMLLPYRQRKKDLKMQKEEAKRADRFLA